MLYLNLSDCLTAVVDPNEIEIHDILKMTSVASRLEGFCFFTVVLPEHALYIVDKEQFDPILTESPFTYAEVVSCANPKLICYEDRWGVMAEWDGLVQSELFGYNLLLQKGKC